MAVFCCVCGKKKPFLFENGFKKLREGVYCGLCIEKAKRDYFCQEIKPFAEANLAKEFYHNQYYSICNFANSLYGLILYDNIPLEIVFLTPSQIDNMNLEMYNAISEINKMKRSGAQAFSLLSNELFVKLQEMKRITEANGPSSDIDFKFEEYWSKRSGERIKEYELPHADLV